MCVYERDRKVLDVNVECVCVCVCRRRKREGEREGKWMDGEKLWRRRWSVCVCTSWCTLC